MGAAAWVSCDVVGCGGNGRFPAGNGLREEEEEADELPEADDDDDDGLPDVSSPLEVGPDPVAVNDADVGDCTGTRRPGSSESSDDPPISAADSSIGSLWSLSLPPPLPLPDCVDGSESSRALSTLDPFELRRIEDEEAEDVDDDGNDEFEEEDDEDEDEYDDREAAGAVTGRAPLHGE